MYLYKYIYIQLFLLLSLVTIPVQCEYSSSDAVVILTEKNFDKQVLQSDAYWLVEFYAPWCGHCKQLEPEYKKAAKALKKKAKLGVVDATVHQTLAQKYNIQGYPTIKEFGKKKQKPKDYRGGRTKKDIVQHVENSEVAKKLGIGSTGFNVETITFAQIPMLLKQRETDKKQSERPLVIVIGSKPVGKKKKQQYAPTWLSKIAQLYTTVSDEKKKKKKANEQKEDISLDILFAPGSDAKLLDHFSLQETDVPTILFLSSKSSNQDFHYLSASSLGSEYMKINEQITKKFISDTFAIVNSVNAIEIIDTWPRVPLFQSPEGSRKQPNLKLSQVTEKSFQECLYGKKKEICVFLNNNEADNDMVKSLAKHYRRDRFKFFKPSALLLQGFQSFISVLAIDKQINIIVIKQGRQTKYAVSSIPLEHEKLIDFLDKVLEGTQTFNTLTSDQIELFASTELTVDDEINVQTDDHDEL